jgi:hypothetical protein
MNIKATYSKMEIISAQDVQKLIERKLNRYTHIIDELPPGAAIRISRSDWHPRKESPQHYFLRRYNKPGCKRVSVKRLNGDDFFVIKL